jgi:propionyl-CoA carboxylase alpha chain
MRKAMGEQAVALARAVGYYSAGTVELIVSGADTTGESFYFLEMNTRLQVEHPVTEEITGLDLVEQMIRVAAGEALAFKQEGVKLNGWAVETRVYAEDPYRNFLPSTGRLSRYRTPAESRASDAVVRVDTGVAEGGEVSMFYDPMIAKLVTWAPTREAAIDLQIGAIDRYEIAGVGTNLDFLSALSQHPRFRSGNITTGFIAEEYPEGFHGAPETPATARRVAAVSAAIARADAARALHVDGQLGTPLEASGHWIVRIDGTEHDVLIEADSATVDGESLSLSVDYRPGATLVEADVAGELVTLRIVRKRGHMIVTTAGRARKVQVMRPVVAALRHHMIEKPAPDMSRFLVSPMPGLLTRLLVAQGQKVEAGQPLATVEAMKMENMLRAEKSATVAKVAAEVGASLAIDQVILEFE